MTFVDLLRRLADEQPQRMAFEFLADSATQLTYAELDARARAIAAALQDMHAGGERVLLVCPPGLDFVAALFGCLYAACLAVPAYPPTRTQHLPRLARIVADAQPAVALTTRALLSRIETALPGTDGLRWLEVDTLPTGMDSSWREPAVHAGDPAIVQYTSGSTDSPRGVVLSHANLLHNTVQIQRRFEIHQQSRGVIWLPPFHDMGLVGGILQGVQSAFPIALMAPATFLRRPVRWLEAIGSRRATISGGPSFAYDLCVERISAVEREQLDLSTWDVAFNGAEPVRSETLDRFTATFAPHGFRREAFYPCYGLAEATLIVTGGDKSTPPLVLNVDGVSAVSSGRAVDDQEVLIVDPESRGRCAEGDVGEIWVRGPSVALGYWRQPEQTREVFGAHLVGSDADAYLRTGDLGFVREGELYVTGRLKSLLFVSGRAVHAEDVESTVAASHAFGWPSGVAAIGIEGAGRERLVVMQEVVTRVPADLEDVAHRIRLRVAEQHQLPVEHILLLRPGRIPRTSSGKVRRAAARDAFQDAALDSLFQWQLVRQ